MMIKGEIKVPSTIKMSMETISTKTVHVESDDIPISELEHILELYPLIKSEKARKFILGCIDGAALFENRNLENRVLELTVKDYRNS